MIRFRSRYQHAGLRYRCIIVKDGKTRCSRWLESRPEAFSDAMFWHKYYAQERFQKK